MDINLIILLKLKYLSIIVYVNVANGFPMAEDWMALFTGLKNAAFLKMDTNANIIKTQSSPRAIPNIPPMLLSTFLNVGDLSDNLLVKWPIKNFTKKNIIT